jgi:hypothetical protein
MIYLASPYSDPDPAVRKRRHQAARDAVHRLTDREHIVFSPIDVSCEMLMHTRFAYDAAFWYEWSMDFLRASSAVWVLTIDGWRESRGVPLEIKEAMHLGILIRYLDPNTLKLTKAAP